MGVAHPERVGVRSERVMVWHPPPPRGWAAICPRCSVPPRCSVGIWVPFVVPFIVSIVQLLLEGYEVMGWVTAGCDTYNEMCKIAETTDYVGVAGTAACVFALGLFVWFDRKKGK